MTESDTISGALPRTIDGDTVVGTVEKTSFPLPTTGRVRVAVPDADPCDFRAETIVFCHLDLRDNPAPGTVRTHKTDTHRAPLAVVNTTERNRSPPSMSRPYPRPDTEPDTEPPTILAFAGLGVIETLLLTALVLASDVRTAIWLFGLAFAATLGVFALLTLYNLTRV